MESTSIRIRGRILEIAVAALGKIRGRLLEIALAALSKIRGRLLEIAQGTDIEYTCRLTFSLTEKVAYI
jgi:hypothetical protein